MRFAFLADNRLHVLGLTDAITGAYVTNASVTATIHDDADLLVATVTLSYVAGSKTISIDGVSYTSAGGNYAGQLPYNAGLLDEQDYVAKVTGTVGGNRYYDEFLLPCRTTRTA